MRPCAFTGDTGLQGDIHDGWSVLADALSELAAPIILLSFIKKHKGITYNSTNGNYLLGHSYTF
ncbi:hypothetical protein MWU78_02400 [Arenibacter sp. F26102]|uniref:hypothetical protein n=1 Tax=Arenibacter sp. F26102 TaxID=2926416 RepID=UPI001FF5C588|nr:hypothetical protein [Arenibacter sp. F26102]MCK0144492.1 hypothetical protein [Arenibacter sp. F26102]